MLYAPTDIPKQVNSQGIYSGNCRVHRCTWALTLATGSYVPIKEADMNTARKNFANNLIAASTNKKQENLINKGRKALFAEIDCKSNITIVPQTETIKVIKIPPMNFESTLDFCASIHLILTEKIKVKTREKNKIAVKFYSFQ